MLRSEPQLLIITWIVCAALTIITIQTWKRIDSWRAQRAVNKLLDDLLKKEDAP